MLAEKQKWSEEAWRASSAVYEAIIVHPFITELIDGTLPEHKFKAYLAQDSLYLDTYGRVLAHIASRMRDKDFMSDFLTFASDGVEVERILHQTFLTAEDSRNVKMSPACLLYTSVLKSQAYSPAAVEAAAVLPCFWVYQRVGEYITHHSAANLASNPYASWIATYSDPAFAESTRRAIEICDTLAAESGIDIREQMTEIFTTFTRLEWKFWDSAYNLEKWEI